MPRRSHGSLRREGTDGRRGSDPQGRAKSHRRPLGGRETQRTADGDFLVRKVPGAAARKAYRCPGCQQEIPIGTPHLVVWPAEDLSWMQSAGDARRHWHSSCWQRQSTKGGPGGLGG